MLNGVTSVTLLRPVERQLGADLRSRTWSLEVNARAVGGGGGHHSDQRGMSRLLDSAFVQDVLKFFGGLYNNVIGRKDGFAEGHGQRCQGSADELG